MQVAYIAAHHLLCCACPARSEQIHSLTQVRSLHVLTRVQHTPRPLGVLALGPCGQMQGPAACTLCTRARGPMGTVPDPAAGSLVVWQAALATVPRRAQIRRILFTMAMSIERCMGCC